MYDFWCCSGSISAPFIHAVEVGLPLGGACKRHGMRSDGRLTSASYTGLNSGIRNMCLERREKLCFVCEVHVKIKSIRPLSEPLVSSP